MCKTSNSKYLHSKDNFGKKNILFSKFFNDYTEVAWLVLDIVQKISKKELNISYQNIFEKNFLFSKNVNGYTKVAWLVLNMYNRYLKENSTFFIKIMFNDVL